MSTTDHEYAKDTLKRLCYVENPTLTQYGGAIRAINFANGWFDGGRSIGDDCMLLVTEVSELYEEVRKGKAPDEVYFSVDSNGNDKPEGIPTELADLFIRMMDFAYRHGIDLDFEVAQKLKYNLTRGYKHGGKIL